MLPDSLLQSLHDQIVCRQLQILQLTSLLDPSQPSPRTIIIHGTTATGKTLTISKVLPAIDVPYCIINVKECITARHLLERTVLGVKNAVTGGQKFLDIDGRCESLGSLAVILGRLLEQNAGKKFVLVFDGVDKLRDSTGLPTLLPGLVRLSEIIPRLTIILVTTTPLPRALHKPGLPHIHFPAYDRNATLSIVTQSPLEIFDKEQIEDMDDDRRDETEEDNGWLWAKFVALVWDSLGRVAARDVVSTRKLCEKLWLPFVSHIRNGDYGTRDFARLVVRTRDLFRDESVLVEGLAVKVYGSFDKDVNELGKKAVKASHELSYYTKHLLLAAYLASYNPSRLDQQIFTRLHDRKKKKIASRKKTTTTTTKDGKTTATPSKHRRISRLLLGPQPFTLERLLAIFHAILPDKAPAGNADILSQVATLASLRMLVKASSGTGADGSGLDGSAKWRVNMGWEYVLQLGKRVDIDLVDYIVE